MDCGQFTAFDLPVVAQDDRNEQIDQLRLLLEDASQLLHAQFVIVRQRHPLCQAYRREMMGGGQENGVCNYRDASSNRSGCRDLPVTCWRFESGNVALHAARVQH